MAQCAWLAVCARVIWRLVDLFEEPAAHAYSSRVNDVRLKAMGHAVVMHLPCNVANLLLYCRRRKIMHDNKYQRAAHSGRCCCFMCWAPSPCAPLRGEHQDPRGSGRGQPTSGKLQLPCHFLGLHNQSVYNAFVNSEFIAGMEMESFNAKQFSFISSNKNIIFFKYKRFANTNKYQTQLRYFYYFWAV